MATPAPAIHISPGTPIGTGWPRGSTRCTRVLATGRPIGGEPSPATGWAVVACDVGSHKLLLGQFWVTTAPHTFFMSNGLSSMGYGLPAAMATSA